MDKETLRRPAALFRCDFLSARVTSSSQWRFAGVRRSHQCVVRTLETFEGRKLHDLKPGVPRQRPLGVPFGMPCVSRPGILANHAERSLLSKCSPARSITPDYWRDWKSRGKSWRIESYVREAGSRSPERAASRLARRTWRNGTVSEDFRRWQVLRIARHSCRIAMHLLL